MPGRQALRGNDNESIFKGLDTMQRLLTASILLVTATAHAEHAHRLPTISVEGEHPQEFSLPAQTLPSASPSLAGLLGRIPGAAVNFNGPLSGLPQYRGLFGDRVNVLLDGVNVGYACGNAMDAPLHYMPRFRAESLTLQRGIAPVSSGIETIGGTVSAESRLSRFADSEAFESQGRLDVGGQTVDDGYALSGLLGLANDRHRLHAGASREEGSDRRFPGGRIRPTRYERDAFDLGYGFRQGDHEWSLDYRRNETGKSGTPALPMDIVFADANLVRGGYQGRLGGFDVEARLYYNDVEHRMSNFEVRPMPNPAMQHFAYDEADALGYRLAVSTGFAGGTLKLGADGHRYSNDGTIRWVNTGAFLKSFNDVRRDLYSGYAEWDRALTEALGLHLGLRYTRVEMEAGTVDATRAQMMAGPRMLRDRFNAGDRSPSDDNVDGVAKLRYAIQDNLAVEVGFARKTRSPSYQERFIWIPLQATGGLADGRLYMGDVNLDPEVAYQWELGLDWQMDRFFLAPRVFYHQVDDYIQGTPATDPLVLAVAAGQGVTNPLQFSNVDARLYGSDLEWGLHLSRAWHLHGTVSYVRGERRDIDDDLYRISPLNGRAALSYEQEHWSLTGEGVFFASQSKVSRTNGEQRSAGYGLLNLYGSYRLPGTGLSLLAGVENVLDKKYLPHLNGLNRAMGSDVAVGERLPGDGISGFLRASLEW